MKEFKNGYAPLWEENQRECILLAREHLLVVSEDILMIDGGGIKLSLR